MFTSVDSPLDRIHTTAMPHALAAVARCAGATFARPSTAPFGASASRLLATGGAATEVPAERREPPQVCAPVERVWRADVANRRLRMPSTTTCSLSSTTRATRASPATLARRTTRRFTVRTTATTRMWRSPLSRRRSWQKMQRDRRLSNRQTTRPPSPTLSSTSYRLAAAARAAAGGDRRGGVHHLSPPLSFCSNHRTCSSLS